MKINFLLYYVLFFQLNYLRVIVNNHNNTNFGTGNLSFVDVDFGKGDVDFKSTYFGDGNVDFKFARFSSGDISFERASFGKGKIDFNKTLDDIGIKYYGSSNKNIYNIQYLELLEIAKKNKWIHELDDFNPEEDNDDNEE